MLLIVAATEPELQAAAAICDAETLACGIGPVDAGIAVARRLATEPRPDAVLHVGIAGCRAASGIELGTLVAGTSSTYCDTDSALIAQVLEPDLVLLAAVAKAVAGILRVPIGTTAEVGGSARCDSDVEAMEGFAVLRAAALADVPAVEVRTIANHIEEPDRGVWRFDLALDVLGEALPALAAAVAAVAPAAASAGGTPTVGVPAGGVR